MPGERPLSPRLVHFPPPLDAVPDAPGFDAPNGDFSCVQRSRSNTPLQALTTLNEPIFIDCARALAARTLKEGGKNDVERLTYAFRLCVSRSPDNFEKSTLAALLGKERKRMPTAR